MRLDTYPDVLVEQSFLTLQVLDHFNLRLGQYFRALISEAEQYRHGGSHVGIANQEIKIAKYAKADMPICLKREDRPLERNRRDAGVRQSLDQSCKFIE